MTKTPAEAVGLTDRGEIAVGKRADLIRVHLARDLPVVVAKEFGDDVICMNFLSRLKGWRVEGRSLILELHHH